MSEERKFVLRDIITALTVAFMCGGSWFLSTAKAEEAMAMASENKAFGIARDKKHIDTKEYARDYAYRKDMELKSDIVKNSDSIHAIREENVETRVKLSHIEKSLDKTVLLLEELLKKQGK